MWSAVHGDTCGLAIGLGTITRHSSLDTNSITGKHITVSLCTAGIFLYCYQVGVVETVHAHLLPKCEQESLKTRNRLAQMVMKR